MKALRNKKQSSFRSTSHQRRALQEQGMALALTMMVGMVLMLASGGIVAKQLMLRRLGAAESYKQIADMASSSGMNRILAVMNEPDTDLSHLWELRENNNDPNGAIEEWTLSESSPAVIRQELLQPCLPINSNLTDLGVFDGSLAGGGKVRSDGRGGAVETSYRLRSYGPDGSTGVFEIEGYTTQHGDTGTQVLSRTLLKRTLYTQDDIADPKHWGVLAGEVLELGNSSIISDNSGHDGVALWMIDPEQTAVLAVDSSLSCKAAAANATDSSGNIASMLWPRVNYSFPSRSLLNQTANGHSKNVHSEVIEIDSKRAGKSTGAICREQDGSGDFDDCTDRRSEVKVEGSSVRMTLHSSDFCPGSTKGPCEIEVQSINLENDAVLSIETSPQKPIILRMRGSATRFNLSNGTLCQAQSGGSSSSIVGCSNPTTQARAEQLVITAPAGDGAKDCGSASGNLTISGTSLPSAVVLMPTGSVVLDGPTSMRGLLWAQSICAQPGLSLNISNTSGNSVIADFRKLWIHQSETDLFKFGRTLRRGIRGKGHDTFIAW